MSLRAAAHQDEMIGIVVTDDGRGIPDPEKPRVVLRFFRCANAGVQTGIGLGLCVVDAVARLHDGTPVLADNDPACVPNSPSRR